MNLSELFTAKVSACNRTYFLDVKMSAEGGRYIVLSESRATPDGQHHHDRVMVFEEHWQAFFGAVSKVNDFLTAAGQEQVSYVQAMRARHPRAYEAWTEDEDKRLAAARSAGKSVKDIATELQRQPGAIESRLRKLGLTQ